jgi:tRNA(Ile2) C34 agmatinyltransferase TiaS
MKFCEICMEEIDGKDGENRCPKCEEKATRTRAKKRQRNIRHQVLTDLGLKRVRGSLGGVYYE